MLGFREMYKMYRLRTVQILQKYLLRSIEEVPVEEVYAALYRDLVELLHRDLPEDKVRKLAEKLTEGLLRAAGVVGLHHWYIVVATRLIVTYVKLSREAYETMKQYYTLAHGLDWLVKLVDDVVKEVLEDEEDHT